MKRKPTTRVKRHARTRAKRTRKEATPSSTLGQNIRNARTKAGMTQLALAHAIGYTGDDAGAYISRVESDTQAPRIDTLLRIAEALQVTMCSLLAS
jgi:transcriptional regulator with XRE-family HTH domain